VTAVLDRPAVAAEPVDGPVEKAPTGRLERLAFVLLLVAVALAHGVNMFGYPHYESDEGTYTAQAQAFVEHGKLAPYTYWYDHAPAGWMLLGLWAKLTGGFFTFGFSVNSGRVLMLLLHLGSSIILYYAIRKITGSTSRP